MKVAAVIALAALCAVVVVAQHPRHCDAPREFEAHVFQFDRRETFARRGHFAYDEEGRRTSFFERVENGTDREHYHVIRLYREQRVYRLNLHTKVCTVEKVQGEFRPIGIRREAHFVGDAVIGTNAFLNSGLLTTHWEHHNKTAGFEWYGVFTDRDVGCVPVEDDYRDSVIGHVHTAFFDVSLGISDPNIFVPDSSCPRVADDETGATAVVDVKTQTAGDPKKFVKGVWSRHERRAIGAGAGWALFKQCDPQWANQELGTCGGTTICAAGCAMSSVAMILRTKGINVNPSSLNSWLRSNGGYASGCDIVWSTVDRYGKTSFQGIETASYDTICAGIRAGHGIVANVRGGSHWVLLTGCPSANVFSVNDPGFPSTTYTYGDVLREAVYH